MTVPRLDLAPKRKRPLSLWNPFDYLLLLYWVFFFPQALQWYEEKFGGGGSLAKQKTWQEKWKFLREHPYQLRLWIQGLLLTVIAPLTICRLLQALGVPIDWIGVAIGVASGVMIGVVIGVVIGVAFGVAFGIASSVANGVANGMVFGVAFGMTSSVAIGLAFGVAFGVVSSVVIGVAFGVVIGVVSGVTNGVTFNLGIGVALGVAFGMASGVVIGVAFGVMFDLGIGVAIGFAFGVAFSVALMISTLRPENWLLGLPINLRLLQQRRTLFSRVTPLPISSLSSRLKQWLRRDWDTGTHNLNQLLQYSLQFIPVIDATNRVLAEIPSGHLIYRVSQLAENPYDWQLLRFTSESLQNTLKYQAIKGFFLIFFFRRWRNNLLSRLNTELRLDTPSRATAAGFWYLHEKQPDKATEAFAVVRSLLYGEEMYRLAHTLTEFITAKDVNTIASLSLSPIPNEPQLRPITWDAIKRLNRVIEDTRLIKSGYSKQARSLALNRSIGELRTIIDQNSRGALRAPKLENILPEAERELILDIATTWLDALERIAGELGNIAITKPVRNPYIIGDPVIGEQFSGREDIIRQLEELWVMGNRLQSVVLYGHRRMGKTSILLNLNDRLGANIRLIYINLQLLGAITQGMGEILLAVSDHLKSAFNITPPDDEEFFKLPQRTFERYLNTILQQLDKKGIVIAFDEFEVIEELINKKQIPKEFMGVLRGWVQMSPNLGFAFAGLHTLEEMTADYFQPFYASVIPIHIGFLNRAATRQILANPINISDVISPLSKGGMGGSNDSDFLLDYTPEALDRIYELTYGQPYLVQLIGFHLVRLYNDYVFEKGQTRDPRFTIDDVNSVINPEFFQRGRYYFEGVWGQAARDTSGQQTILKALAPHPQGLTKEALMTIVDMDEKTFSEAIKTLKHHDVVAETDTGFKIIVELFRRWVVKNQL